MKKNNVTVVSTHLEVTLQYHPTVVNGISTLGSSLYDIDWIDDSDLGVFLRFKAFGGGNKVTTCYEGAYSYDDAERRLNQLLPLNLSDRGRLV